jgi:hypothetical protein
VWPSFQFMLRVISVGSRSAGAAPNVEPGSMPMRLADTVEGSVKFITNLIRLFAVAVAVFNAATLLTPVEREHSTLGSARIDR